jgi:hypothetical protein
MSCTAIGWEPRRWREEALFDEQGDERELLWQAEDAERRLMERVAAYEEAERVVPEQLLERLEEVRERIGWIEWMVAELGEDGGRR